MNLLQSIGAYFTKGEQQTWAEKAAKAMVSYQNEPRSAYYDNEYPNIYEVTFDGEKTQGELGAPISYLPDYNTLAYRSLKAYTDSDLAQIILKAHVNWVIGSGLKLQAEPNEDIINAEGFNFDKKEFIKVTESRYRIYVRQNFSYHSKMMNFNKAQRLAYLSASVGGDVLCIKRIENGLPTIQLIDGVHVQTPNFEVVSKAEENGNKIVHGVEYNDAGTHIRFYVRNKKGEFETVEAYGSSTGREQAFMVYGSEYRIDSVRGLPLLSAVLEKIEKLDRYNEAIVSGVEEQAKVAWQITHNQHSTGENPDLAKLVNSVKGSDDTTDSDKTVDVTEQTRLIKKTYNKDAINMPIGSQIEKLGTGMEKDQEAFVTGNFIFICAALEIPYEVALMKYVNSFSSSRMASQSFLFILNIKRVLFNDAFNQKFYNTFLDTQILAGKIKAEGYFSAQNSNDVILLGAYRNARFTGPGVPQADPSKEVKAEVTKIEKNLTTHERAMEVLDGNTDFYSTIEKLGEEREYIKETMPEEQQQQNSNT